MFYLNHHRNFCRAYCTSNCQAHDIMPRCCTPCSFSVLFMQSLVSSKYTKTLSQRTKQEDRRSVIRIFCRKSLKSQNGLDFCLLLFFGGVTPKTSPKHKKLQIWNNLDTCSGTEHTNIETQFHVHGDLAKEKSIFMATRDPVGFPRNATKEFLPRSIRPMLARHALASYIA